MLNLPCSVYQQRLCSMYTCTLYKQLVLDGIKHFRRTWHGIDGVPLMKLVDTTKIGSKTTGACVKQTFCRHHGLTQVVTT